MTRRAALAATATVAALVPWAGPAEARVSCRTAFDVYESPRAGLFTAFPSRRSELTLFGCTSRDAEPRRIHAASPATTLEAYPKGRYGRHLALEIEVYADGGNGRRLGWFDTRSGRRALARSHGPRAPVDPEDDGSWTPGTVALAVGPDGALGYAYRAHARTYEVWHRPFAGPRFGDRALLATVPRAELDPGTLRTGRDRLTWRTQGERRSAAVGPAAADPARRLPAGRRSGCRAGRVLHFEPPVRVFRHRGAVHACAHGTRAARLAPDGRLLLAAAAPRRSVAALLRRAGRTELVVADLPGATARRRTLPAGTRMLALAGGPDASAAYVERRGDARAVVHVPPAGRGLGAPVTLAELPAAEVDPRTLRFRGGTVTWRTVGAPRSIPAG